MPAIVCHNVGKLFGDLAVLRGVNLVVSRGEIVTLVGESGSGKSTLLRIIAGLLEPGEGTVHVFGQSAEEARRARAYGIVFQNPTLYAWRTVEENVALPLEIIGLAKAERAARVGEALDLVRLTGFARSYPAQLSGGMAQRVAIARALAYRPPLLLLDEPFAALDALTRIRMHQLIIRLWRVHTPAVLLVTHDVDEALLLADRVLVLANGQIAEQLPIRLPRPRQASTPGFQALRARLLQLLGVETEAEPAVDISLPLSRTASR